MVFFFFFSLHNHQKDKIISDYKIKTKQFEKDANRLRADNRSLQDMEHKLREANIEIVKLTKMAGEVNALQASVKNAEEEKMVMEGQYKKMRKLVRNSVLVSGTSGGSGGNNNNTNGTNNGGNGGNNNNQNNNNINTNNIGVDDSSTSSPSPSLSQVVTQAMAQQHSSSSTLPPLIPPPPPPLPATSIPSTNDFSGKDSSGSSSSSGGGGGGGGGGGKNAFLGDILNMKKLKKTVTNGGN